MLNRWVAALASYATFGVLIRYTRLCSQLSILFGWGSFVCYLFHAPHHLLSIYSPPSTPRYLARTNLLVCTIFAPICSLYRLYGILLCSLHRQLHNFASVYRMFASILSSFPHLSAVVYRMLAMSLSTPHHPSERCTDCWPCCSLRFPNFAVLY